jgi:hypothetical protein
MAEVGFLNRFRSLVLTDDSTRWRLMTWTIIATGVAGSVDLAILKEPLDTAVPLMGILAFLILFGGIVWHCSLKPTYQTELESVSRRRLIYYATTGCVAFVTGQALSRHESKKFAMQISKATAGDNFAKVADLFNIAKGGAVRLDPELPRAAGKKSVRAASRHAEAWDAAVSALNYKSFQDATFLPLPKSIFFLAHEEFGPFEYLFHYTIVTVDRLPSPAMYSHGLVPRDRAAKLDHIGRDLNQDQTNGNDFVILVGGWLKIDTLAMRHVVLKEVDVVYEGGPVELEDVYFLNCTFHLPQQRNTVQLAVTLLDASQSVERFTAG